METPLFIYWSIDQPTFENECVFMSLVGKGGWKDRKPCSQRKSVLCKMPRHIHIYSLTMTSDGRVKPQCLRGHEIKNMTVKGVVECGEACWAEPRCRSFNLGQRGPPKICQLNNATIIESDEGDVVYDDQCNYFEI